MAMSVSSIFEGENEPVAIVGMGCRFSGGVKDSPSLWELLRNKRDGWREFKEPRFPASGFYHPNQDRPGSIRTRGAFLCDDDAREFDHAFFGITGREVETMDPSQRKLLEVVYEALENAGETWDSISGSQTGVYVGMFALDHVLMQSREWDYTKPYAATGAETSILANRISYVFNLHGPSLATNTACSSSMYALHLAVSAIRSGDCDGAIVAAANWINDPSMQIVLDKLGALSPTSRCHTFDIAADGYARGEGFSAIYLKKSTLALLEGMPIRAMIRGTGVNANGKTGGITRPSARGQEDAIRKAYENAGNLPFEDTTFFECHGTGTPAGDPLEVAAVGNVFASSRRSSAPEDRLLIGSIKPNLGHTEGASALASIMKVVLSLEAGEIAPTYGVENLNPNIDFDGAKVLVVKDGAVPWPKGKVRRASVNSFGFGGANGHCIIDHVNEVLPKYVKPGVMASASAHAHGHSTNGHTNGSALSNGNGYVDGNGSIQVPKHLPVKPQAVKKSASATTSTRQLVLLPFSAHNASSLKLNIETLSQAVADPSRWSLADVAYTLGSKRSRLQQRTFRIVDTKQDAVAAGLAEEKRVFTSPIQTSNVAFVFTGQGAQWHAMGAQLFEYDVFRSTISHVDYVLQELRKDSEDTSSWTIAATLTGDCESDHIQSPHVSQVACTALQLGLVDLLASWSVWPRAVAGHSSGEMGAAYAAGHLTAAEAVAAAYFRGRAVSMNKQKGAMLAVGLGADQVASYIEGKEEHICVAAMNSPGSATLSGDADAVAAVAAALSKEGIFNRVLKTSGSAYHSYHMVAVGGAYSDMLSRGEELLKKLGLTDTAQRYPRVPWASSVKPDKDLAHGHDLPMPHYWRENLESPVQFTQAVTKLMSLEGQSIDVLVEIGPHSALKGPIEQTLKGIGKAAQYATALTRNEDGRNALLQLAGTLFAANTEIDLAAVNSTDANDGRTGPNFVHGGVAIDLPAYQYSYGPISYYESRMSKEFRLRDLIRHDLLGSEVLGASKLQPQWRNVLRVKDVPWLSDHRLLPDVVFPAAGYIALGVEVATRVYRAFPGAPNITGYSFRKVDIDAALRIPEDDYGIEVIVSAEIDKATTDEPAWVKFAVTSVSRDSSEWTRHCTGLVKVEVSPPSARVQLSTEMDPRYPSITAWYDKFTSVGLGYGRTFQPLSDLQVDPHRGLAKAAVALDSTTGSVKGGESSYPLHPAALDATFQLAIIVFYGGQLDHAAVAFVPVQVSQLYLKAGVHQDVPATAIARGSIQGLRSASAQLQMVDQSGEVFLEVDSIRFAEFRETKTHELLSRQPFSSPFTRLVWKPDIRTLADSQIRELFPPPAENAEAAAALEVLEMICCLVAFDIYDSFVTGSKEKVSPVGDIRHWLAWIKRIVEGDDQRTQVDEAKRLSPAQRLELLEKLYLEAGDRPEAQAARLLHQNAAEILHERRTGIDVLISHKLLTPLYEVGTAIAGSHPQVSNVMDVLAHVNPNARILEIGAGTGAATRAAMRALVGANGIKRYADYTFTDISAGFLASAREMLSDHRDVNYSVLDVEQDPMEHGYEPVYDIVLACEAIHATESMTRTLAHCRTLLKPGGRLVLVETTRMRVLLGLLYGTLTGYWQSDDRTEGPFMNLETWQRRLTATGFSGVDLHVDDYEAPHNTTSVLVTTRVDEQRDAVSATRSAGQGAGLIYLLHDSDTAPVLSKQLSAEFERRGVTMRLSKFPVDGSVEQIVPPEARVIVLLSDRNDLFDADATRLHSFQYLSRSARSMVWLTAGGIVTGEDPRGAFMLGLLRVIATENPAGRFFSINIEGRGSFDQGGNDLARSIVEKEVALQRDAGKELDAGEESTDSEFVWQDGCLWVSRVVPDAGLGEYAEPTKTLSRQGLDVLAVDSRGPVRVAFETAGILNSLYFRPYTELLQPLPDDHVDVKIAAVGLSLRDVAVATGRSNATGCSLSSEYAGVVTKVGAKVTGLSVGDRIYGVGKGLLGNYERVPAAFAQKLESVHGLVESATIPLSFMSAVYAFEYVARLRKGHRVLIQSAAGDLGLAAVQVARVKGAEVFVVADAADEVAVLVDTIGIPRDCVFLWPQDRGRLRRIARASDKQGFNVILNTMAKGDSLHHSLQMLAPLGHLIEMCGDGGVQGFERAGLGGFEFAQKNANLSSFDLIAVLDSDPELGRELMETVQNLRQTGQITPIRPVSVSTVANLDQTLLDFSKKTPTGKVVVSFQDPDSTVKILRQPQVATFDPEARYIITGGFGGLGRGIIRWMADRGAQEFVVLSRRAANTPAARMLIHDMMLRGVHIEAVPCDVSKRNQVVQVISGISKATSQRPIKGVVHAVLSLSDLTFDKLTIEQWRSGTVAKTKGTINLHEATLEHPLDFFVLLTSTETVWAPATQAAYIAADNFAAYFARYRRRLGLPASTVSYGFVSDLGSDYRETSHGTEDLYARNLAATMTESQALATLEPAFLKAKAEVGTGAPKEWVGRQHDPLSEATFFTCLSPLDLAALNSTHVPRWHRDGRVALLLRAVRDARRHSLDGPSGDELDGNAADSTAQLRRAFDEAIRVGPGGRAAAVELVTQGICKAISEMLFIDPGSVNPARTVAEHGVDSLIAAELRSWFHRALRKNLRNLLDSHTSIGKLAEEIVNEALAGGE